MTRPPIPRSRTTAPVVRGMIRPRLLAVLDEASRGRPVVVAAPAGAGKTTLLAQWAGRFTGRVAWYRADASDQHCVPACLHAAVVTTGLARSEPAADVSLVDPQGVDLDDVVRLIEGMSDSLLLVIDDAHELGDGDGVRELRRLVSIAPPGLRLVIGTRTPPAINLLRTELGGLPTLLSGADLRFRSGEVEHLFRQFYGEALPADDAVLLARRTEGWAAALALFHLATRGRDLDARRSAVRRLAGRSAPLDDYLAGEVLADLAEHQLGFLRRTCVFEVLTAQRCESLLGVDGAQRTLEELARRQALTSSDDGGVTFRYHEVLQKHLHASLIEELGEAQAHRCFTDAAQILEQEGAYEEALQARSRGHDWQGACELLRVHGEHLTRSRRIDWATLLPSQMARDEGWVQLALARGALRDGQLELAERGADRAAELLVESPAGLAACQEVRRQAHIWRTGTEAGVENYSADDWVALLRAATTRAPCDRADLLAGASGPHADLVRGLASLICGDLGTAHVALDRVATGPAHGPSIAARLVWATIDALADPGAGTELLAEIGDAADRLGLPWLGRIAHGMTLAATATTESSTLADDLARECDRRGDVWGAVLVRGAVAVRLLRLPAPNTQRLDRVIGDLRRLQAGALEAWLRSARALTLSENEEPEAEQEARIAESFARAANTPGALALAYAALAAAVPAAEAEFTELARVTAQSAGLPAQVWAKFANPDADHTLVRIDCFHTFRIRLDDDDLPVEGVRPRARSLLRLLALHGGASVHRQLITDALWPEMSEEAATHNLQVAVSALRRMLHEAGAPVGIGREGDAYRLVGDRPATYDITEFSSALGAATRARARGDAESAAAELSRALGTYAGDLLTEEGTADWVTEARERYRMQAADAAATLAELHLARGQADLAAETARRGLQLDRWHDRAWRALIAGHHERGERAAAYRAEAGYRAMLAELETSDD